MQMRKEFMMKIPN